MAIKRRHFLQASVAAGAYGLLNGAQGASGSNATALITKTIPKTGEQLPVIGVGTNQYGVGSSEEARAPLREVLKIFSDHGGTLIDTAPSYGRSEAVLGDLIRELGIGDQLFMSTKCDKSSLEQTSAQIQQSSSLLGSDPIDLMEVHNMRSWQTSLPLLRERQQEGKLRYIGVTTSRDNQHRDFAAIMRTEPLDFVQLNYNILSRAAEQELLPLAAEKGIAVLVNLPFARGGVFSKVEGVELPEWAKEFGCQSWGNFFLKYNLSHPAVTACIPGTTKPHHALDNIQAAMGRLPDAAERKMQEDFIAAL